MGDRSGTIANIGKQFLTGYNPLRTIHIVQNKAKTTQKPAAGEKNTFFSLRAYPIPPRGVGGWSQKLAV